MMRNIFTKILFTAALLSVSGCYRIQYEVTPPNPRGQLYNEAHWYNFFVFGTVPSENEFTYQDLCHSGELKEVDTYRTPGNVLASLLSVGLVMGSTLEVTCLEPSLPPPQP